MPRVWRHRSIIADIFWPPHVKSAHCHETLAWRVNNNSAVILPRYQAPDTEVPQLICASVCECAIAPHQERQGGQKNQSHPAVINHQWQGLTNPEPSEKSVFLPSPATARDINGPTPARIDRQKTHNNHKKEA